MWRVLEHTSSSVGYDQYRDLLDHAAALLPAGCQVVFLAGRGFADIQLMRPLKRLGWHWCVRLEVAGKASRWVDPHRDRDSSYLKMGWNWIRLALVQELDLITRLRLAGEPDPEPAVSSQTQFLKQTAPEFRVQFSNHAP